MNFNAADPAQNGTVGRAGFNAFSPKAGVLFEPSAGVQFYANYSRSVEFPGFIELGQVAAFVPFDAQRAWTAEAGTRGRSGPLSWDATYYRSTIKGELLQFAIVPDIPASTFNAGRTPHAGVEDAPEVQAPDGRKLPRQGERR